MPALLHKQRAQRAARALFMASVVMPLPETRWIDRFDLAIPAGVPISGSVEIAGYSSDEGEPRLLLVVHDFKSKDRLESHVLDPATWSVEGSAEYMLNSAGKVAVAAAGDLNKDGVQDLLVTVVEYPRDGDGSGTCLAVSGADLAELFRVSGREHRVFFTQAAPDLLGQEPSFWILHTALEPGLRSHGAMWVSRSGEVLPRIPIPGLEHEPTLASAIRGPGGASTLVIAEPTFVQGVDESFGGVEHVALSLVACVYGLAFVEGQSSVKSVPIGTSDLSSYGQMVACGDPNGDGIQDVAVSLPHEATVRLLSGSDLSVLRTIESPSDWFLDCGGFGSSMALLPDCDADGIDDLVVGNMEWCGETPEGARWERGAFHVYSMASGYLIDSVYGGGTVALGSGFAAFRDEEGVLLIAVASRELLCYRIAAN